jgi:hypothetical protein
MRTARAGCLAVLVLGVAFSVAEAQSRTGKPAPAESSSWWSNLFGNKPKEDPKKQATPIKPVSASPADRALEQDRLMKAYMRRLEVCDRIREVAHETNNDGLFEEANHLEDLAWKLYQGRSNKLLGISTASADEEPTPNTAEVLRSASPGGAVPPRLRPGGKMEPSRAQGRSREEDR